MRNSAILTAAVTALFAGTFHASPAVADSFGIVAMAHPGGGGGGKPGGGGGGGTPPGTTYYSWMSPDIKGAWNSGYFGQGASMTFVDDFSSGTLITGNLGDGTFQLQHGQWTSKEATMLATQATPIQKDFSGESTPITLQSGFNVVNASYDWVDLPSNYSTDWATTYCNCAQEQSIIDAATAGSAVISKAAGNDSIAVGTTAANGTQDFLANSLIGSQSAIFVGALDYNGTVHKKAPLSSYSNYAGSNPAVQSHFLVVGVNYMSTGLAGTSFAAPIISAYASVLHSKFNQASATSVVNQLLSTARTDTVRNYSASVYGMGEASLANALAPASIN